MQIFLFAKVFKKICVKQDQMREAVIIFCSCKKNIFAKTERIWGFFRENENFRKKGNFAKFHQIHVLS
jgi:hypothetical protein